MRWVQWIAGVVLTILVAAVGTLWIASKRAEHGHIATEITIERPPAQVFRWLTDDELVKKWVGGLSEIRTLSRPPGGGEVGRALHLVEIADGRRAEMLMMVSRFEQDRALSLEISSVGDPAYGFSETADYTLADLGGKTRLHFDVRTQYAGWTLNLLEPLITPEARKKLDEDFHRLKTMVESEPPLTAPTAESPALQKPKKN